MMSQTEESNPNAPTDGQRPAKRSIFNVPAPIKQLFDKFPLVTYNTNDLPHRAPRHRNAHVLYVFTTDAGASRGAPSFNPACLKWQAYLKFSRIPFRIASSTNHASPSGSLPFILPSSPEPHKQTQPVPAGKLQKWAMKNCDTAIEEPGDLRYEAYLSLLDHRIRRAWLYTLYLSPNIPTPSESLYILPASINPLVRLSLAHSLRRAAQTELLKHCSSISADTLYTQAEEAFAALESLLGGDTWFFGATGPGLFDASVFAYTHLLLDEGLGLGQARVVDRRLGEAVRGNKGLLRHRERVVRMYFL